MKYVEPVRGKELIFDLIPVEKLVRGDFQRDLSTGLRNKLRHSTDLGFIIPVVVVKRENGFYEVIDGQHRLAAIEGLPPESKIPAIIVPQDFKFKPLIFNVEKGDNIKDKCVKVHSVYMWYLQNKPDADEVELLPVAGYEPSVLTLAFAYVERGLKSPSLVETIVKKFDAVLSEEVSWAAGERRRRAQRVVALEDLVNSIAAENGFTDFNLKKAVISKSSMTLWGRQRNLGLEFDEAMDMLEQEITSRDWSGFGG